MKRFLYLIKSDLKRGIISKRFLIAFFIIILAVIFAAWQSLFLLREQRIQGLPPGYFLNFINQALKSEGIIFVLPMLSTIPYAGQFMEEFRTSFCNFILIRSKKSQYILAKIIVNGLCGWLCVCAGVIFVIVVGGLCYWPREQKGDINWNIFVNETTLLIIKLSFMGMLWASLGTFLGLINKSIYMVYGGPFLVNYVLVILSTRYFTNAYLLNPREWVQQLHIWHEGYILMGVFLFTVSLIFIVLEGVTMHWKLKRR